jgi:hypothetical protein
MSELDAATMLRTIAERQASTPPDAQAGLRGEWAKLCRRTADRLDAVVGLAEQAAAPEPGSLLEQEIARVTVRNRSGRPIRALQTAILPAAMSLSVAADSLRSMAAALPVAETVLPVEVLGRHILECASTALWLLAPRIGGRARVARLFLLRYESGVQEARAAKAIGTQRAGPTPEEVAAVASDWGWHLQKPGKGRSLSVEGESLPGPTNRAEQLLHRIRAAGAYHLYSGSSHAEMYGLWRALSPPLTAAGETYNLIEFDYLAAWHAVRTSNLSTLTAALDYLSLKGRDVSEVLSAVAECETALTSIHPELPQKSEPPDTTSGFHDV